jgi:hypothetical protein
MEEILASALNYNQAQFFLNYSIEILSSLLFKLTLEHYLFIKNIVIMVNIVG